MSAHDHDHGHHDGETYYLDQICMVGISAAFGVICLTLYISNAMAPDVQSMLKLLLGEQFHLFVLGGGIALCVMAALRGVTLWRTAGQSVHAHDHHREHGHGEGCGHDHGAGVHEPHHTHPHHLDHDAEDHGHGWAPWRYVLLLVPIVLFLLGLPNKGPQASAAHVEIDPTREIAGYAGMIAGAQASEGEMLSWVAALYMTEEEGVDVPFMDFKNLANRPELRAEKQGKTVRLRGQFVRSRNNEHVFQVIRWRVPCCGADAIPVPVPMVARESVKKRTDLKDNEWVKVTGVIDFMNLHGEYTTVLRVLNLSKIEKCPPDSEPYIR